MPITNFTQLARFSDACGAEIPRWIRKTLESLGDDRDAQATVGHKFVDRHEQLGKQVVTLSKQRLGKVTDYATEVETMYVQKIYVSQGIIKGLTRGSLGIDRSQINEITDKKIIVNDLLDSATVPSGAMA